MKIGKNLSQLWYNTLKKIFFKDLYQNVEKMNEIQATLDLATVAAQRLVDSAKQFEIIKESADNILEISKEKKHDYAQQKKDHMEFQVEVKNIKQLNKDLINKFLITNNNQISKFMMQLSAHIRQKNINLLEQITENNNQQDSEFIEQISNKLDKQNFSFITQNSKLTKEILAQSIKNYDTINKKFEKLVSYPFLVRFSDDLITLKTSMSVLEKLDHAQSKTFYNLYLKYQKLHPNIPILDMTQGVLIIKILFPPFFAKMLKNLTYIKSHLDDDTMTEMTGTIKNSNSLFQSFNRSQLKTINLDSHISTINKIIMKLMN